MDKEANFSSFSIQYWLKKEISTEALGFMKKNGGYLLIYIELTLNEKYIHNSSSSHFQFCWPKELKDFSKSVYKIYFKI